MMSREEMKQEFKETEGSPQTRGRIRRLQRQMRRRKVKADVSRAAVVLTNPTHYAVALGFDFVTMDAPRVLAKGQNLLAEEIKTEARWAGVPIIENPPLARSLYRSVELVMSIPVDLYEAVASILAYLYRQRVEAEMRERRARQGGSQGKAAAANHCKACQPVFQFLIRASEITRRSRDRPPDGGHTMSTAVLNPDAFTPAAILDRLRDYVLPMRNDQRDLCHADSAAGRRAGLSPRAFDGSLYHRFPFFGADSPRR